MESSMQQQSQSMKSYSSLVDSCKERIISQFSMIKEKNPQILNFILVLDDQTLQMISSYMKMNELIALGIQSVEKLELKRKPFPRMAAIYFISSTNQSIKKLCEDFQTEQNLQYGLVFLLLTSKISESDMEIIGKTTLLAQRLKALNEINQDFSVIDDDIFDLGVSDALSVLYSTQALKNEKILKKQEIAQKIFTLLTTFDKFFEFEIVYNEEQNQISKDIALQLDFVLDDYIKQLRNLNNIQNLDKSAGKITILLIDRSFDTLTPTLHDFYYQSLLFDIMNVEKSMVAINEQKNIILNYEDKIFQKYKYTHIAQLFEDLPDEFQLFLNKNQEFKNKNNKDMDINTMSKIIKGYNSFSDAKEKYSLHLELCSKMKSLYNDQQLAVVGDIEQTIATGVDQNGKEVKESKLMQQIFEQLKFLSPDSQFRLILSTFLGLLTNDKDKLTLVQELKAKFPEKYQILTKIRQLGVVFGTETKYRFDKDFKKVFKNEAKSTQLLFCRYIPKLASILDNFIMDIQSNSSISSSKLIQFKSLIINKNTQQNKIQLGGGNDVGAGGNSGGGINDQIPHSIRRKKLDRILQGPSEQSQQQSESNSSFFGYNKLFVVILGGISYTELRSIMNQNKMINNNLIIKVGGTSILKPSDYINAISMIKTDIDY